MGRRLSDPGPVFGALADPTRRDLLEAVARQGPITSTQLAAGLPITRQAVAKHLGVLRDAGLVVDRRRGREVAYEADLRPLAGASDWLERAGRDWDRRLGRLGEVAADRARRRRASG